MTRLLFSLLFLKWPLGLKILSLCIFWRPHIFLSGAIHVPFLLSLVYLKTQLHILFKKSILTGCQSSICNIFNQLVKMSTLIELNISVVLVIVGLSDLSSSWILYPRTDRTFFSKFHMVCTFPTPKIWWQTSVLWLIIFPINQFQTE